jgi:hypothetical protein
MLKNIGKGNQSYREAEYYLAKSDVIFKEECEKTSLKVIL